MKEKKKSKEGESKAIALNKSTKPHRSPGENMSSRKIKKKFRDW